MARIGINGWFLSKPATGIGQYTTNLLHAMAKAQPKTEWIVAVPAPFVPPKFSARASGRSARRPNSKIPFWPANVHLITVPQKRWLPTASLRKWVWEQFQVPALFKRKKVNLAHYPYPSNPRFPGRHAPKTVVTVHDVIPWTDPAYRHRLRTRGYQAWAKKALFKADRILCVSQTTADALTDQMPGLPLQHVKVVHEAPAPDFLLKPKKARKRASKRRQRPYFIYVGGYDARKNVQRLVEAFQEYIAPRYAIDLVLVGGKDAKNPHYTTLKNLQSACASANIQGLQGPLRGRVRWTAPLSPEELAKTYRSALALVHPSLSEGFNLPLLEAAACDTPLLVSDISVHREILGENALFSDPTSSKALGQMLLDFLNDPPLQERLRRATFTLRATYTWQKAAAATLKIYGSL